MMITGAGESDPGLKTIEAVEYGSSKDSRIRGVFHKMAQKFNVHGGMWGENSGKFIFTIYFKTDEIDYKKVRDEFSKDPIIEHVAMYAAEIEDINRYLPQGLGSDLTRWQIV